MPRSENRGPAAACRMRDDRVYSRDGTAGEEETRMGHDHPGQGRNGASRGGASRAFAGALALAAALAILLGWAL